MSKKFFFKQLGFAKVRRLNEVHSLIVKNISIFNYLVYFCFHIVNCQNISISNISV